MGCERVHETGRNHIVGKKTLVLRKAVRFFKGLGHKSPLKDGQSSNPTFGARLELESLGARPFKIGNQEPVEMPPRHSQLYSELSSRSSHSFPAQACPQIFELDGLYLQSLVGSVRQSRAAEVQGDSFDSTELLSPVLASESSSPNVKSDVCSTRTGNWSIDPWLVSEQADDVSKLSRGSLALTSGANICETLGSVKTLKRSFDDDLLSDDTLHEDFEATGTSNNKISMQPLHASSINIDDYQGEWLASSQDSVTHGIHSTINRNAASPATVNHLSVKKRVEALREIFIIVRGEWEHRLSSISEVSSIYSKLSGRNLFMLGLTSLKRFYEEMTSYTFNEVFALMHIAWAVSYLLHESGMSSSWDELCQDMLTWHCLISIEHDRSLFVIVVERLWVLRTTPFCAASEYFHPQQESSVQSMKNGRITQDLTAFLSGVFFADIFDHRREDEIYQIPHKQYSTFDMVEQILQPLLRQDGIEALRCCVIDAWLQLGNGILKNPWEVEAMLISTAIDRCRNYKIFRAYFSAVTFLCDGYMQQSDPTWRHPSYVLMVEVMQGVSLEADEDQGLGAYAASWPDTDVLAAVIGKGEISNSAISGSAQMVEAWQAPSSATSTTFSGQSSQTGQYESNLTSPTTSHTNSSLESSSPVTPTSPTVPKILHCDLDACRQMFTGEFRVSNLRRHKDYASVHNRHATLLCPEPECGSLIRRTDNLKKHYRTSHPGSVCPKLPKKRARKVAARAIQRTSGH
ncbi:hypothetical protein ACLMJK_002210 [Lecanora helva]